MELAIEVMEMGQHRSYVARIAGREATIGRGWNNDLVIRDPLVDAEHLRLYTDDDGQLMVEDLGSRNGSRLGGQYFSQAVPVPLGKALRIGHSTLIVHDANEPVEKAQRRPQFEPLIERMQLPWVACVALLFALASAYFSGLFAPDLSIDADDRWSRAFAFGLGLIVWAAIWGSVARLLRHEVAFWGHLTLVSLTTSLVLLGYMLISWLSFNLLSLTLKNYGFEFLFTLALFGWCILAFDMTTRFKPLKRSLVSVAVTGAALILLFVSPVGGGPEQDPRRPPMVNITQPPSRLIASEKSIDEFLSGAAHLFGQIEQEIESDD